jgi:hypothetical protein
MDGIIAGTFHNGSDNIELSYGCNSVKDGMLVPCGVPVRFDAGMHGNFVLVPRIVYQKIGNLYAGYTHAMGDYDYAYQVRKAGFFTFCSGRVLGFCHLNRGFDKKRLMTMSLSERIKVCYTIKGYNLREYCVYKRRHFGWRWVLSWCKGWLTILFPQLKERYVIVKDTETVQRQDAKNGVSVKCEDSIQ